VRFVRIQLPLVVLFLAAISHAQGPQVISTSPVSGPVGTSVQINGSGFGSGPTGNTVTFNGVSAAVGPWSDTQITATVPSTAVTGPVVVKVGGVSSGSDVYFNIPAPAITSISPSSGVFGTTVTVNGSGFQSSKGSSTITFGGLNRTATTSSWSDTQIVATVPSNGITGPVVVTVNNVASNSNFDFAVPNPVITSIAPTTGPADGATQVQINGSGFGATQASNSSVTFPWGHTAAIVTGSWSDNQIVAKVPAAAVTGGVQVTNSGVSSNSNIVFTVPPPQVTSISPTSGNVGTTPLTINGSGFQNTQGGLSSVYINGTFASVVSGTWSDTQIKVTVPSGAATGPVTVTVNGVTSNANVEFTMPNPVITGLVPSSGPVTTQVQINGSGFGATQGSSTITFNGVPGTNITWHDTQITATVPTSAVTGAVKVTVGGVSSNTDIIFTVPPPHISSISPTSGGVNTPVTVTGSGFGNPSSPLIRFNGTSASFTTWSDTQIQATVPATTTGPVQVTVNNILSNNDVQFTLPNPVVSSVSPVDGPVGTPVTINGSGFGAQQGNSISFGGTNATTITGWTDSQITAQVPSAAATGAVKVTNGGVSSNTNVTFTVGAVTVGSVSPSGGPASTTQVTVSGAGFGTTQGTVSFNGTNATSITSWSGSQIVATVPAGATTGPVKVVAGGVSSNTTVNFTVTNVVVNSVSPTSGIAGAQLQINGSGFGTTQGSVTIGPYSATVVTWSANQITVTPPTAAITGAVKVTVGGVASNADVNYTILGPTVSSVSPTSGPPGLIYINGNNFGSPRPTNSNAQWGGTNLTINNWTNTQIQATLPAVAGTAAVSVNVAGLASNSNVNFSVPLPHVSSISPSSYVPNTPVTINGSGFQSQGSNYVQFYNQSTATIVSWSDTQIVANVQSGAITGPVQVFVSGQGSNTDVVFIMPSPSITGLSPTSGPVGTQVTINGTGFGASQGSSTISFNGVNATVINNGWTDTQITALVPTTAGSGPVKVIEGGVASNTNYNFLVPAPRITSLSPVSGVVQTQVTVNGSGFTGNLGSNTISFSGVSATIVTWNDTQIVAKVPTGATTGPVKANVNSQVSNQDIEFIVPSPVVTALSPTIGPAGTQVTISGSGFGPPQGTVTFNAQNAAVSSWSDTQIVATVPVTAITGPVAVAWGGVTSNANIYFQVPAPVISTINPGTAGVGNTVTVTGSGFQASQGGNSALYFASGTSWAAATVKTWSDTQIVATVPTTANTGSVKVQVNAVNSNYVDYIIPANVVTSVSPTSGPVNTQVTVNGSGFGTTQGTSTLTFNGQPPSSISAWGNTQITALVAVTATTGPAAVTVANVPSNITVIFTVPPPAVTNMSPAGGTPGTQVTINGSGFQANQRDSTVTFNGTPVPQSGIVSWSDAKIVATVPSSATSGPLSVTVNAVPSSSSNVFDVPYPTITSVSSGCGAAYGLFTITGSGFGATQGAGLVYINGTQQGIAAQGGVGAPLWSDTSITFQLQSGTTSGPLTVNIYDATSNALQFSVEGAPTVTGVNPPAAPVGASVTVTGTGFCAAQSTGTLRFNAGPNQSGPAATVTSWSDTQIIAFVPPGSSSGPMTVTIGGVTGSSTNFNLTTTVQITDSFNNSSTYTSEMIGGAWYDLSSTGSGCSSCTVRGTLSNTYDGVGNLLTHTDELSHVTTNSYDSNNNLASQSQPLDSSNTVLTSFTYNSFGEPLTVTDPLGNVTTNTYDANGNLLTVTTPAPASGVAASVTQFAYDTKGELTQITDPLSNVTKLAYNTVGLISSITDAQNNVTSYGYDPHGNRTSIIDALNNQTTFAYDAGDRLTKITYPDQTFVSFAYDTRGRRTSVTDQNNKTTSYAYDDADRLISVTDAANNVTQYAYDTENNLLSITDAANHATSFTYDAFGRVSRTTFPSSLTETYVYDSAGNLTNKTDRNNHSILYVYDALNRLTHKGYPDSTGVDYVYDLAGKIKQVTDPTGTYGMAYDNMGRLIGTTTQYAFVTGTPTFSNTYGYDAGSNRTSLTLPDSSTNTYQYDTLNRLAKITDSITGQFLFGYDGLSRRNQLTRPNGVNTNYGYDTLSRLLSVLHQTGTTTLDGATYTYDNAGNRASKTNKLNNITEQYTYDPLYQLTQVTQGATTTETYSYDLVGNRLSSLGVSSYSYNSSNELTSNSAASFTYDANGNTLSKTNASGTTQYGWDFENRLKSVITPTGTVTFVYDPLGRRIQKAFTQGSTTTTTNYLYDGANIIRELDGGGNALARYAQNWGVDQPLAEMRSGTTGFYQQDGLNSVTSLSSSTGTISNSYTYDAFGNLIASAGSLVNPFQYTGRDLDPETGLRYYRARYFDPTNGRFLSEDPIGFDGGINFYKYAANRPTNLSDPSGLCPPKKSCGVKSGPHFSLSEGGPPLAKNATVPGMTSLYKHAEFMNDETHDPSCCEVRQYFSQNRRTPGERYRKGKWYEDEGSNGKPAYRRNAADAGAYHGNMYDSFDRPGWWEPTDLVMQFVMKVVDTCNGGKVVAESDIVTVTHTE
jgi:RHS repeat-associated protein